MANNELDAESLANQNEYYARERDAMTKKNAPAGTDKNVSQSSQNMSPPAADAPPKAKAAVGGSLETVIKDLWRSQPAHVGNKQVEDAKPFNTPVK